MNPKAQFLSWIVRITASVHINSKSRKTHIFPQSQDDKGGSLQPRTQPTRRRNWCWLGLLVGSFAYCEVDQVHPISGLVLYKISLVIVKKMQRKSRYFCVCGTVEESLLNRIYNSNNHCLCLNCIPWELLMRRMLKYLHASNLDFIKSYEISLIWSKSCGKQILGEMNFNDSICKSFY